MTWSLLREIGIDYVDPAASAADTLGLRYPVFAERADDGTTVIVDETGLSKNLTVLTECRTVRVDAAGRAVWDSIAAGIHDGYGCALDGGRTALLRRTTWDLLILDADGSERRRIDLSLVSPHMARVVTRTARGTLLVSFIDHVYHAEIAELDEEGHLLWMLPQDPEKPIGCPTNVQQIEGGGVLVTDEFCHVAAEYGRDGRLAWQYGERRNPAGGTNRLSNPMGARRLADGRRVVADTRNHRVLAIAPDADGAHEELAIPDVNSPTSIDLTRDGTWLVSDAGNRRVIELDADLNVVRQFGRPLARRRPFSFPRSVEGTGDGAYVLADTAFNRVVSVTAAGAIEDLATAESAGLFWPRCARVLDGGGLLIADGRRSRVVETGPDGAVVREVGVARLAGGERKLKDPHDVQLLPNGHVLVADASLDLVLELDWDGAVHWVAGEREGHALADPHSAQALDGGEVVISDTNAHRLVWVGRDGTIVRELSVFRDGDHLYRLNRPKHAAVTPDGLLAVVASFNNRVLAGTPDGRLRWVLDEVPGSPLPQLSQPRWATLLGPDEVVVSDHSNHRLVHLRRTP